MKFGIIRPAIREAALIVCKDLRAAQALVGLEDVDHGAVAPGVSVVPPILWLQNQAAVECAISWGLCARPQMSVNGDVLWRWPNPPPRGAMP